VFSGEDMALSQIWKFVEESIDQKKQWGRIDLIGGEPTLYKKLDQVFGFMDVYRQKYPRTKFRFSTNGIGKNNAEILSKIPDWIQVRNSAKEGKAQGHDAYHIAPVDCGEKDVRACSIPWRCGIGLTKYGYFPCGAGASLAKVFGMDIGIKSLAEVTPTAIKAQLFEVCKYCGHSNTKSRRPAKNEEELSPSWEDAVKNYKEGVLEVY